jgi:hypothetical protein
LPTRRYGELARRLAEIERHLLPAARADLAYTSEELDRVRGYLVLCHAEIEACIEDLARRVLSKSRDRWKGDRRARPALVAVVAYHESGFGGPARKLSPRGSQKPAPTLDDRIATACDAYDEYVRKDNHGVRESNLLRVLLPVGVRESDLDPAWVADMETFGIMRGIVAHVSARAARARPDPVNARSQVQRALKGLRDVDALLSKLSR